MKAFALALLTVVSVGVVIGKPQGHQNNCDSWCRNSLGHFTCCDKLPKCPVDDREPGDCNRQFSLQAPAVGNIPIVSGPFECADDSECGEGAICCPDKCIGHDVCKNLPL
ncbi:uncharacterized protein LOC135214596 [Macrobrachium nipponense]|uniref:uncharacterized protein LOC135214596 n=1 Tax=Macrobrachium nipponense TaxID=159736 RepID=UPI0030C84C55